VLAPGKRSLSVDHMDHVWFLNRNQAAQPIELTAEGNPSLALCCVRGPELIELDQQGNVVHAWGGVDFHPKWPIRLQTGDRRYEGIRLGQRRSQSGQRGECGGLNKTPLAAPGPSLFNRSICGTIYKMVMSKDPQQKYVFVADAHNDVIWTIERQSGRTLGYFGSSGRLAGQLHFPNAIGIDTRGNIYVGEVDNGKRIQKFAPVLTAAR
jgi:hypothetical protein